MSPLTFFVILYVFLCIFLLARGIGYTYVWHYYTTNSNSLGHCIYVHQEKISAAAGLGPGNPGYESTTATIYVDVYLLHIGLYSYAEK